MSEEKYIHEGGVEDAEEMQEEKEGVLKDASEKGKEPEDDQCEHKGVEEVGVSEKAIGSDSVKPSTSGEDECEERIREEEKIIEAIAEDLLKGGDLGKCFVRLCDEVKINRREILRIQYLLGTDSEERN